MSASARGSTSDPVRNAADLVLLSVLADGPLYGYAITKRVAAQSGGAMKLGPGVLYPLLHQLEGEGLLLSSWETIRADDAAESAAAEGGAGGGAEAGGDGASQRGGGRRRKWYRLSARGRRRLAKRIESHRAYHAIIESFIPDAERGGASA